MEQPLNIRQYNRLHHAQPINIIYITWRARNFHNLLFTWKTHHGLKFHFGQINQSEICTEVSFTLPEPMRTLIMKLPYLEMKFYLKRKSQIGLSSLWVSCKHVFKVLNI